MGKKQGNIHNIFDFHSCCAKYLLAGLVHYLSADTKSGNINALLLHTCIYIVFNTSHSKFSKGMVSVSAWIFFMYVQDY